MMILSSPIRTFFVAILIVACLPLVSALDNNTAEILMLDFAPSFSSTAGNNIYIHNTLEGSVSVLDGSANKIKKTLVVESQPRFSIVV